MKKLKSVLSHLKKREKTTNDETKRTNLQVQPENSKSEDNGDDKTFSIFIALLAWVLVFSLSMIVADSISQLVGASDNTVRLTLTRALSGIIAAIIGVIAGSKGTKK